jgi:L-rhamnose-H+ transport protein
MILFVFGLKYVGISVSFILNIAVGTVIGSILPIILLNPSKLASAGGLAQITALIVFLIALCFMMTASKNREATVSEKSIFKGKNIIGILVGSFSGLLTSAQGFVYSYCLPFVTGASVNINAPRMTSTLLTWALIFNAALLPYALFFLIRFLRSKEKLKSDHSFKNIIFLIVMSIFYYGSIIVFSKASISLGTMGSVIAWPILMITIILTSNFWGWKQGEWKNSGIKAIKSQKASIVFLLIAVVLLTVAGYFNLS